MIAERTSFQEKPLQLQPLKATEMTIEEILNRYAEGKRSFQRVNLREVDLQNAHFHGVNFNQADLRQARLGKTDFSRASFREADLSEALLCGTDLSEADLD